MKPGPAPGEDQGSEPGRARHGGGHVEAAGDGVAALSISRKEATAATAAIGRLTKNTRRHDSAVVSRPPGQQPHGSAGAGDRRPRAERSVALIALGEDDRQQTQSGGGHERCAQPLDGP